MSRTRRFLGGVGFGYVNQFLVTVVGLWLTPFLLHRVGQSDYGLWLVGTQVVAYLMLMDLGVVALLPRETAFTTGRAANTGSREELSLLTGQTARLAIWQTPLVALVAAAIWFALPAEWEPLRIPLGLILLGVVLTFPLRLFQAVLHGLQDMAFMGKAQLFVWLASTALTVVLVAAGWGLYALAAGWVATQVLLIPLLWLRLRRRFPGALPARLPHLGWAEARRRLGQGSWMSLNQIAQVLMFGTDLLIIGKLLGPAAVVPYACTGKLISVLANQPQMLMQVAGPALSEIKASESRGRVAEVCSALGQVMLLASGGVVCVVLSVNQGFINWWVGADNFGGLALTMLMLLNMLLRHWNLTVGYAVFFFGYDRHIGLTALFDGLVTVVGIIIFVWLLGPLGAPLGSLIGVSLVSLPRNLRKLAHETEQSVWRIIAPVFSWAVRFFAVATLACLAANLWTPKKLPGIALIASLVASVYTLVMLPLLTRKSLSIYLPARLNHVLRKIFGLTVASETAA